MNTAMNEDGYDPRAIANLLLDLADGRFAISNLSLQKLLYFAHGISLLQRRGRPLVSGFFEAWEFGPVHPAAYRAFKSAGDQQISFRAEARDPLTGERRDLPKVDDPEIEDLLRSVLKNYGQFSAAQLVKLSHSRYSPWSAVVGENPTKSDFGARISNELIASRFRHHYVPVDWLSEAGEVRDENPPDY